MRSQVNLTPALQIGFSGHMKLSNESLSRDQIVKVLSEWKMKFPDGISGLSSLAAGGDLLFAEACFELGIPLRVLLPMPPAQFSEDFETATWKRAENALERAVSAELAGGGLDRPHCYYECGLETILQSGLLIVLWNGRPAQGIGGTGEMAECCKNLGTPVIWIHSETGEITRWNGSDLAWNDPELTFLNALPDRKAKPGTTHREQAVAWLQKLDENANRVAPQFRKIAAAPILCAGIAAVLTVAAYNFKDQASLLFGTSALLGLIAALAPKFLKAKETQERWAKIRTAAEVSRSFLALWDAPMRYDVIDKAVIPELHGMLEALNHLKTLAGFKNRKTDFCTFKDSYQRQRIAQQGAYFSQQTERADRVMSRAQIIISGSVVFAITGNLFCVMTAQVLHLLPSEGWMSWLGLAVVLAYQIAAAAGAMNAINDYARRQQRFLDLRRLILDYGKQLEQTQSWTSVLRVVSRVEKTLLTEVIEWRALYRNQKFGK
ncbi:MAG: hypothetical protein JO170_24940 [Verrucomicrobia bacterium]|nr:hypothetical protein [Verrucomicrobiota bacterium]